MLAYRSTHDLIPLYSVYALLFTDSGLSVAQVSSLFVIWSVTGFVLEVPSGAWADTIDRRRLLVLAAPVHALGFASRVLWPTYPGLRPRLRALGRRRLADVGHLRVAAVRRARRPWPGAPLRTDHRLVAATAMTANLVASVSAAPLMALGGYDLVGWASVAVCLVELLLAATLPVTQRPPGTQRRAAPRRSRRSDGRPLPRDAARGGPRGRAGDRRRRMVLIYAVVIGASAYDEYFPLVAAEHGVAAATVPWLIGLTVLGQVVGTALAGRTAGMSGRAMGLVLLAAALLISAGALAAAAWLGFVGIAVGYGLLNNAMVVSETRLQDVITGPARATATSVAGLATEVSRWPCTSRFAATADLATGAGAGGRAPAPVALVGPRARPRPPAPAAAGAGAGGGGGRAKGGGGGRADQGRGHRAGPRARPDRRGGRRLRHAQERRRRQLSRALPVPRREVAVVQRHAVAGTSGTASAARPAATSSRSSRRSTSWLRRGGRAAGRPHGVQLRYEEGGGAGAAHQRQRPRLVEAHQLAAEFYAEQLARRRRQPARSSSPSAGSTRRRRRTSASASRRATGTRSPAPARPRASPTTSWSPAGSSARASAGRSTASAAGCCGRSGRPPAT